MVVAVGGNKKNTDFICRTGTGVGRGLNVSTSGGLYRRSTGTSKKEIDRWKAGARIKLNESNGIYENYCISIRLRSVQNIGSTDSAALPNSYKHTPSAVTGRTQMFVFFSHFFTTSQYRCNFYGKTRDVRG